MIKQKILLFVIAIAVTQSIIAQKILAQEELSAENVKAVQIKGSFCDVVIKNGSKVYFKGIIEGDGDPDDYDIEARISGDELIVVVEKRGSSWGMREITKDLLELTLPNGVNVEVDNSSGDIRMSGVENDRTDLESTSGDITIADVMSKIDIEATSGDIEGRMLTGNISVESTSGDIELNRVSGNVEFNSTSGDVDIAGFSGSLSGRTTSGEIELSDGKGALDLRTTSGGIEAAGITLVTDVNLRTTSGDIDFDFTNDMSELSFDLRASSGDIEVGDRSEGDDIYIKEGSIWIRAVSSSGDQQYDN